MTAAAAPPAAPNRIARIADRLDQAVLVGLYVWLVARLAPDGIWPQHAYAAALLVSEGAVVLFVLLRRSAEAISLRPKDWTLALGGTGAALLVDAGGAPFLPGLGVPLIVIGFAVHVGAKFSLRRSFGIVPADRGVKAGGLYRLVRHPMYLGYMISHAGFFLSAPSYWNFAVYAVAWALLVARAGLEEDFLMRNPDYRAYAKAVRRRLVPGVY
ncbi:MAG: methyltransferase [Pseudomonadota bacterium]